MKLFIFDFDGTLLNTLNQLVYDMNTALKLHNFPKLSFDEFEQMAGGNINQVISNVLGTNSTDENIEKVKETYLEIVWKGEDTLSKPFDKIIYVLNKLESQGHILAINSNRYTESINFYVKKFFKNINFIDIQGHNPPNPSKPDPYGVLKIIEKTEMKKEDIFYVGDSQTDIDTAMNAGIKCIYVTWGYSKMIPTENVYKIINHPENLLEMDNR